MKRAKRLERERAREEKREGSQVREVGGVGGERWVGARVASHRQKANYKRNVLQIGGHRK